MGKFYEGGFQPTTKESCFNLCCQGHCQCREAQRGVYVDASRDTANAEKLREVCKRVMVANHPDAGGSHYLASKINEAKDVLTGKTKGGGSAFWLENEQCSSTKNIW